MTIHYGSSNQNLPNTTEAQLAAEEKFEKALAAWLVKAQNVINENHARMGYTFPVETLRVDRGGKKYLRIVKGSSVYSFIDIATGDVLKAESWKRPAKGARGNIYTENLGVTAYGGQYWNR